MRLIIHSGKPLQGEVRLPGDKSISHRAALFAALAEGESRVENFLVSGVTNAMLDALTAFGIHWELAGTSLRVHGCGLNGLQQPQQAIDCGNSATTLRLLAGAAAASGVAVTLDGSPGLRRRPMERIIAPLQQMGVAITASPTGTAPLSIAKRPSGVHLRPIDYTAPVASAQVKTCILLAGLAAEGRLIYREAVLSRDHTERMLEAMGVEMTCERVGEGAIISLMPPSQTLQPLTIDIPGDFSAAAFLIVAALITPGSQIVLRDVGLNPTRIGLLVTLQQMGGDIQVGNVRQQSSEPLGDVTVRASLLHSGCVSGQRVVDMIDEFPIFAVAAAYAKGETVVCDAQELRHKESDRISALCQELSALGVQAEEKVDGFNIFGQGHLRGGGTVNPHGDHRLAMSLAVAGLGAEKAVTVEAAEIISESFPDFITTLKRLGAQVELEEDDLRGKKA